MYEHMHEDVKKLADAKNVKRLRYVFADCLDVDPSFHKFEDDFQYCRDHGIFEAHEELTPRREDPATWDMDYWVALKGDLLQNLSVERLQHMRDVAKVLFPAQPQAAATASTNLSDGTPVQKTGISEQKIVRRKITPGNDKAAKAHQKVEEAKRQLEEDNARIVAQTSQPSVHTKRRGNSSKKAEGVPTGMLVPILIVVALIILYLLLK